MSELSKITILKKATNSCEVRIDSIYNNGGGHSFNSELEYEEHLLIGTLFYFLVELASRFHENESSCPLAVALGKKEPGVYQKIVYNEELALSIISSAKILDYQYIFPDMDDKATKEKFDSYLEEGIDEVEIKGMLSQRYFITEVVFKDEKWLKGIEVGMTAETSYDTFICDWLK